MIREARLHFNPSYISAVYQDAHPSFVAEGRIPGSPRGSDQSVLNMNFIRLTCPRARDAPPSRLPSRSCVKEDKRKLSGAASAGKLSGELSAATIPVN